jgi:hypothetical protein
VIEGDRQDEARPALKAGRACLTLLITDKDGNKRVVECEADISPPGIQINQPIEAQGPN